MKKFKDFLDEAKKTPFQGDDVDVGIHPGKPFKYVRNTESAAKHMKHLPKEAYDRHIEPAGRYMVHLDKHPDDEYKLPNMEYGEHTFQKPLIMHHGDGYGEASNWKQRLHAHYKKSGKALSKAVAKDGYDGIVTVNHHPKVGYHSSEIVDLTMFHERKPE